MEEDLQELREFHVVWELQELWEVLHNIWPMDDLKKKMGKIYMKTYAVI